MRRTNQIVYIIIITFCCLLSEEKFIKGQYSAGLFQPLKYNMSNNVAISSHPISSLLIPNIKLHLIHNDWNKCKLMSNHSIVIPSPLLKKITRDGIGGFISSEFKIPFMISLKNEISFKRSLNNKMNITASTGMTLAYTSQGLDERSSIDLPLIYPRLGVYYNGFGTNFGLDLDINISPKINILTDYDILFIPGAKHNFTFEHKGFLSLDTSKRTDVFIGYKLTYGDYPFGSMWYLIPIPLIDIVWKF